MLIKSAEFLQSLVEGTLNSLERELPIFLFVSLYCYSCTKPLHLLIIVTNFPQLAHWNVPTLNPATHLLKLCECTETSYLTLIRKATFQLGFTACKIVKITR